MMVVRGSYGNLVLCRNDRTAPGARDDIGNSPINRPHVGGLNSRADVQLPRPI